jgi:hypothetical protein
MNKYDKGKKMTDKIGSINDMTVLFFSKSPRGSDRLLGALAESLSEGTYEYGERQSDIEWSPIRYGVMGNITFERYEDLKDSFEKSTFNERFFRVYYKVKSEDWKRFNLDRDNRVSMVLNPKPRLKKCNVKKFTEEQNIRLHDLAEELKVYGSYASVGACRDICESLLFGNCAINGRCDILDVDFKIVERIIKELTTNPFDKKIKVLVLLREGRSVAEICELLGYKDKSKALIYRWIRQFRLRGVIE